jgi:hypothetical protein
LRPSVSNTIDPRSNEGMTLPYFTVASSLLVGARFGGGENSFDVT